MVAHLSGLKDSTPYHFVEMESNFYGLLPKPSLNDFAIIIYKHEGQGVRKEFKLNVDIFL